MLSVLTRRRVEIAMQLTEDNFAKEMLKEILNEDDKEMKEKDEWLINYYKNLGYDTKEVEDNTRLKYKHLSNLV